MSTEEKPAVQPEVERRLETRADWLGELTNQLIIIYRNGRFGTSNQDGYFTDGIKVAYNRGGPITNPLYERLRVRKSVLKEVCAISIEEALQLSRLHVPTAKRFPALTTTHFLKGSSQALEGFDVSRLDLLNKTEVFGREGESRVSTFVPTAFARDMMAKMWEGALSPMVMFDLYDQIYPPVNRVSPAENMLSNTANEILVAEADYAHDTSSDRTNYEAVNCAVLPLKR